MSLTALRDTFTKTITGRAVGAAMLGAVTLASFGSAATAQEQIATAPGSRPVLTQPSGKPVLLRVGPGFSMSEANYTAAFLEQKGCPTTVTTERGFPKHLTVEVGSKAYKFTKSGSAGASALDWCLDKS